MHYHVTGDTLQKRFKRQQYRPPSVRTQIGSPLTRERGHPRTNAPSEIAHHRRHVDGLCGSAAPAAGTALFQCPSSSPPLWTKLFALSAPWVGVGNDRIAPTSGMEAVMTFIIAPRTVLRVGATCCGRAGGVGGGRTTLASHLRGEYWQKRKHT